MTDSDDRGTFVRGYLRGVRSKTEVPAQPTAVKPNPKQFEPFEKLKAVLDTGADYNAFVYANRTKDGHANEMEKALAGLEGQLITIKVWVSSYKGELQFIEVVS